MKGMRSKKISYADDDTKSLWGLLRLRSPSLLLGLFLGVLLSFMTSQFKEVLTQNIEVAFFIPFVVYMADAIGTQTQAIYARDLRSGKVHFRNYLIKESQIGFIIGAVSSAIVAGITFFWFGSLKLTLATSLAMFFSVACAPLVALCVTEIFQLEHSDPAAGAGPIATVIQDTLSVVIYGLVASYIIL
jgi:magnesium transporter